MAFILRTKLKIVQKATIPKPIRTEGSVKPYPFTKMLVIETDGREKGNVNEKYRRAFRIPSRGHINPKMKKHVINGSRYRFSYYLIVTYLAARFPTK
jgi:hypothetical protein